MSFFNFFSSKKKKEGDQNIKEKQGSFISKITKVVAGKDKVDEEVLDELEETLIAADIGVDTSLKIINHIEERVHKDKYVSTNDLNRIIKEEIESIFSRKNFTVPLIPDTGDYPYVILVVGVNGVGKTTTIGKMATFFTKMGKKVILGSGDTFRAAADNQLHIWAERTGADIVSHGMNTDPASVAYDTVKQAVDNKSDVVIIDTAGRLHNKVGLMNQLSKIKKVIQKFIPEAPHDVMLVLDGTTGQNAFIQTEEFTHSTDVTCLTITKLDGTAKGGFIIGISDKFNIPIKFIGIGEGQEDLKKFEPKEFIEAIF